MATIEQLNIHNSIERVEGHHGSFNSKQSAKKKRKSRTAFTNHQIYELEQRFIIQKYLSPTDRDEIALSLGLTNAQVITWFQNRRAKYKRDIEELQRDLETAQLQGIQKNILDSFQAMSQLKSAPSKTGDHISSALSLVKKSSSQSSSPAASLVSDSNIINSTLFKQETNETGTPSTSSSAKSESTAQSIIGSTPPSIESHQNHHHHLSHSLHQTRSAFPHFNPHHLSHLNQHSLSHHHQLSQASLGGGLLDPLGFQSHSHYHHLVAAAAALLRQQPEDTPRD